jgi:hypothetical protein
MLPAAPPPTPVSFSREVAPILAMHCSGCHGEAGGFSTRGYRELMLGGNLGKVIIPGDPERSVLIHFIDGRRGERQRMPKQGRPLTSSQVDTLRRWIAEGAHDDDAPVKRYRMEQTGVSVDTRRITQVRCRVNSSAYIVVTARDPANSRVLWSDVASVKRPREGTDAGEPGETILWDLRAGRDWPPTITLELSISYVDAEPVGTEFSAKYVE